MPKSNIISMREIIALAVCAVAPGAILAGIGLLSGKAGEAVWAFSIVTKAAFIVALFVGVPLIILMNMFQKNGIFYYVASGILVALALAAYFIFPNLSDVNLSYGWPSYIAQFLILVMLSELAILIYWLIARPDRKNRHDYPK